MNLSIEDEMELLALQSLDEEAETFTAFVMRVAAHLGAPPPHLLPLYELVERTRHEQVYATVSMPPRHGKTTSLALAVAWRVLYDPACLNFYTTFADDRATNFGRTVRKLVSSLGVPLEQAAGNVGDWRTFAGGGLKSTSKGGQIIGEGANGGLVVCDDLLKGLREARSKAERDHTHEYLTVDVMSRLEGGSSMIVLNTRWDEDDSIGRIMEDRMGLEWVHINMPAVHDGNLQPIDDALYPERAHPLWVDVDAAEPGSVEAAMRWYRQCRARGEHQWWALYQGVPRSESTQIFGEPARYCVPSARVSPSDAQPFEWHGKRGCIVMDPAATAKTSADFTAIGVIAMEGFGENSIAYVVDAKKVQITVPAAARLAYEWQLRYKLPLVVEAVGAFKAIPQMLREIAPRIDLHEAPVRGDKHTRAQPAAAAWNTGRFLLPAAADSQGRPAKLDWVEDVIQVAKSFTGMNDAEDDLVDMIAHGYNFLLGGNVTRALSLARL